MSNADKLPRQLNITAYENEQLTLRMSYGLLNMLVKAIVHPDNFRYVNELPEDQEKVLMICCTLYDKEGNSVRQPANLFELNLDPDEAERVLAWAGDHVLDFFTRRALNFSERMKHFGERIKHLQPPQIPAPAPTSNGTSGSPSTNVASSPTDVTSGTSGAGESAGPARMMI